MHTVAQWSFRVSKTIFPEFRNDHHLLHQSLQKTLVTILLYTSVTKKGTVLFNFGDKWQDLRFHIPSAFQCVFSVSVYSSIYGSLS